mmetsp:Transcript_13961/g.26138  ORF Transcript_13961/g.26138 Transcript_13961/m.26138 type:complete len:609 (+) Transcript_13961:71-1897(+)
MGRRPGLEDVDDDGSGVPQRSQPPHVPRSRSLPDDATATTTSVDGEKQESPAVATMDDSTKRALPNTTASQPQKKDEETSGVTFRQKREFQERTGDKQEGNGTADNGRNDDDVDDDDDDDTEVEYPGAHHVVPIGGNLPPHHDDDDLGTVTSANDNPTTTSSTPVGTTAAVNNLPVAEAIHAETVGNDVENRVGTMEDTIRQLNSQLQNIVYAEQVQVKDDDGDGNDDGGAAAAEGVWTKRKPMIISILAVLIAGIAIAVALTMMGKKPDSATADSSVTSTPLPTGSDVSTAPDATPAPSVFSGDEKPATVIFKFSKMLNDLQMTLFGISELPPDSQTVWEEFTKVFSEQIISDSVDDFVTSYTVVDVFQPASKRQRQLKGERGHRDLQDGDGVRVQYTQYIEFATTDELITPLSLAILPFQTEESRAAYVSFLQRSEDSVLQMVTSSTNVSIQETWESPTSPSPTQRPVTEPTPQPVTPQPVTGPTTPSPTAATASPTRQPTPPPAPAPTPPPTNSPTRRPTVSPTPRPVDPVPVYANPECQELCGSIATGVPVTTTGRAEFQAAILEYLKDPSSSPYGSTINCWDVSRVRLMAMFLCICSVLMNTL